MSTAKEITVTNVGPVAAQSIPFDPDGGITLIYGFNGAGKDTILDSIGRMTGSKADVTCRDGASQGRAEGFGVKLTVGQRTRLSGEAVGVSLGGKFDLSSFVDPPYATPDAADRHRIKALLSIRGVEGNPHLFDALLPDMPDILTSDALAETDVVEQARKVRDALNSRARIAEDEAEKEHGRAEGAWSAAGDVSAEDAAKYDDKQSAADLEAAVAAKSRLTERQRAFELAQQQAASARASLKAIDAGPTVEECESAIAKAFEGYKAAQIALRTAQDREASARAEHTRAQDAAVAAKRQTGAIAAWSKQIDEAAQMSAVDPAEIEAAGVNLEAVKARVQRGQVIIEARRHFATARTHEQAAQAATERASTIREAAKQVDSVLNDLVSSGRVRVEGGRLVVDHPRRPGKPTPFAELSKGERWRLAIMEAVECLESLGVERMPIPIPQQAWEGLQPAVRAELWREAKRRRVSLLAAQCDDGPLRAGIWAPPEDQQNVEDAPVTVAAAEKVQAEKLAPAAKAAPKTSKRTPATPAPAPVAEAVADVDPDEFA